MQVSSGASPQPQEPAGKKPERTGFCGWHSDSEPATQPARPELSDATLEALEAEAMRMSTPEALRQRMAMRLSTLEALEAEAQGLSDTALVAALERVVVAAAAPGAAWDPSEALHYGACCVTTLRFLAPGLRLLAPPGARPPRP